MDDTLVEIAVAKLLFIQSTIQYDGNLKEDQEFDEAVHYAANWGKNMWETMIKDFEDKESPWFNGKHMGDCTNHPISCPRCIYESYIEEARDYLNTGKLVIFEDDDNV